MSDDQPGQTPGGQPPAGSPPPPPLTPPPPLPPPPSYPSYPTGQPASPYAQAGYGPPPGMPAAYGGPVVPYAHWGLRVAAYLLDMVVLIPGYIVAAIGAAMTGSTSTGVQAVGTLVVIVGYVAIIGFVIWNLILRQGRTGASLGKQWVGIRVIREDTGQPLGGWLTFGRSLLHILDGLPCYLGYLWPLWDAKRQTFADKIVGSVVLQAQAAPSQAAPWTPGAAPYGA